MPVVVTIVVLVMVAAVRRWSFDCIKPFLCWIALIVCCVSEATTPSQDLDFIYHQILDNHPGIYNQQDPEFLNNLQNSYKIAKERISESRVEEHARQVISSFVKGFNDTHCWMSWNSSKKPIDTIKKTDSLYIKKIKKDIYWIRLPTFDLNKDQKKGYQRILRTLPKIQKNANIVFDLRGNQGGNSGYATKISDTLFGEGYTSQKRREAYQNTFIDWRVSPDNIQHLRNILIMEHIDWVEQVLAGMEESQRKNQNYYREPGYLDDANTKASLLPHNTILNHDYRVFCIIDGSNVSAVLDFIDDIKLMTKNVVLIGKKTKADRLYMEVRGVSLPSSQGQLFFPIKVYRNRIRGDNIPYMPDVFYTKNLSNTKALVQFITDMILGNRGNG